MRLSYDRCVSATVITKFIRVTVFNHQIERLLNKKEWLVSKEELRGVIWNAPKRMWKMYFYIYVYFFEMPQIRTLPVSLFFYSKSHHALFICSKNLKCPIFESLCSGNVRIWGISKIYAYGLRWKIHLSRAFGGISYYPTYTMISWVREAIGTTWLVQLYPGLSQSAFSN